MKPSKYKAIRTTVDGIVFDSKREARRYQELVLLGKAYKISRLERQISYELAPAVRLEGEKRLKPALRYVADFRYFDADKARVIVEDCKGRETPVSRIKRHLMKSVHGIDVRLS